MNILNIKFKGYGNAAQHVCDNCPCCDMQDWASDRCRIGYWESREHEHSNGIANIDTGEVVRDRNLTMPGTWYEAYIRPQICIDKHGL